VLVAVKLSVLILMLGTCYHKIWHFIKKSRYFEFLTVPTIHTKCIITHQYNFKLDRPRISAQVRSLRHLQAADQGRRRPRNPNLGEVLGRIHGRWCFTDCNLPSRGKNNLFWFGVMSVMKYTQTRLHQNDLKCCRNMLEMSSVWKISCLTMSRVL